MFTLETKKNLNKKKYFLFAIIFFTSFLRLFNISSVPPSVSLDEASIGYNAYSILQTGRDEYGYAFPLLLRAYDDWRPALYVYLVVPFISIFGLSTFAIRFPSVLLSVMTVFSTYFLAKAIVTKYKTDNEKTENISLLASFLLAISPWSIYLSRLGHEANAGIAFFVFGLTLFLYQKYFFSFIFLTFSFASYQSEKIFIPLIMITLAILFWKNILQKKAEVAFGLIISFVIVLPFLLATLYPNALIRFQGTNVFSANRERFEQQAISLKKSIERKDLLGIILNNRRVLAAQLVAEGYFSHFNPVWLFWNSGNEKHKVPNMGLLYVWELPFLLIGIVTFLKSKMSKKIKIFIFLWILFSPIPSSFTTESPHAMRSYTVLPSLQILIAVGIWALLSEFKKQSQKILIVILGIFSVVGIYYFLQNYFIVFPKTQSASFQYALSKTIPYVLSIQKDYKKVIFSNTDNLYQSYMFFLFYSQYNPFRYQKLGGTRSGGFAEIHRFDKYEFRPVDLGKEVMQNDVLYVVNVSELPDKNIAFKTFQNLDDKDAIALVHK